MQTYNPILKSSAKATANSDTKPTEHKYGNSDVLPRVLDSHCRISSGSQRNPIEQTILMQSKPRDIEEIANSQLERRTSSQPWPSSGQIFLNSAGMLSCTQAVENSNQCDLQRNWPAAPSLPEPIIPLKKFRNRSVVSVTSFSSQLWCEKQFELQLKSGKRRETAAMRSGIERHSLLELDDHAVVDVDVSTIEDYLGLRLYSSALLLKQLLEKGKCREVWVVGLFGGIALTGIIDEIQIRHVFQRGTFTVLSDTKTRRKRSDPSVAQTRTSSLQLQLYYYIVSQLQNAAMNFSQLFDIYECDPELFFNVTELRPYRNLNEVVAFFNSVVTKLPSIWESMEIVYENEGVEFRRITVDYNQESLRYTLQSLLEWWFGNRDAQCVPKCEAFKCKFCDFLEECSGNPLDPAIREKILEERRKNELLQRFQENANILSESGLHWEELRDIATLVNQKETIRSRFSSEPSSILTNRILSNTQTTSYQQHAQRQIYPDIIDVDSYRVDQNPFSIATRGEMCSTSRMPQQNLAILPEYKSSEIQTAAANNSFEMENSRKQGMPAINVMVFPPQNCNLHLSLESSPPRSSAAMIPTMGSDTVNYSRPQSFHCPCAHSQR
ncbi:hypothetical protein IE077_002428 [Cardiosporidium cionae]|uniref:Uncharacterized protein n=1 Tax=Cardiosporidium cionae TaxID=476202 RepID=A0ABQ7J4J9_9APIC|nr:hypothetical protein IE077_002428 [Cardiosporidium cionae]|eukprot:KAF8817974.1 hypothetical protein IE077_002428 [Cardiosporidium cionae]